MAVSDYVKNLGRLIDPEESKKKEEEAARDAALKLSDLEEYYRQWVEGHLYNKQDVYTNPLLSEEDEARMESDDFNRFLNAYLLILQEQGIDVNDPSSYIDEQQREMNYLDSQIKALEGKTRTKEQQAKYEELRKQRQLAEDRYNKANNVWKYVEDARGKGWTPDTVGDSGADFGAIDQSAADRKYMQDRREEGFGSGGDLSDLWMPEEKEPEKITWNGGEYEGYYIPAGIYTEEQWQDAITNQSYRIGEDGLTDYQRQQQIRQRAEEKRRAQMMASLIDGSTANAPRNATTGWLSDEYPDIDTRVADANTSGITMTDAGKAYLAELAAKQEAETTNANVGGVADLASLLGGGGVGRHYSGRAVTNNVGSTGLTPEETAQMQRDAYLGMLDAMARGRAATGGYTNSAALQAANSVYDAYEGVLPDKNRMASYLRYQGDSGNRAANPQYNWLNRARNGGFGTTEPTVSAPVTGAQQTQGSIGTIPNVSGGTPVSGTPVGTVTGAQMPSQNNVASWLQQLLGRIPTQFSTPGFRSGSGQLKTPNVMQAQNNFAQYLNSLLKR